MSRRWRIPLRRRARFFPLPPSLDQTVIQSTGIPSEESVPTTGFVNDFVIRPTSIPSGESFGTATVVPGPTTVTQTTGIPSGESFGTAFVNLTFDLTTLRRVARRAEGYELVMVARQPQPSGPPALVELDAITWSGLAYTDELSRPQSLQVGAAIDTLTGEVLARLLDMRRTPSELWLYRAGELVFAGPLITYNTQGPTISFQAWGALGYLRYWQLDADAVFAQVDQHTIVKTMVDGWQASPYGNYGITTDAIADSGVLRDATYKVTEGHNIGQRVEELGRRANGFDAAVDPTTRALQLWYPQQGTDRSTGDSAVVFDGLSISSMDIAASVAPGDVISDAMGTGTGTEPIWNLLFNPDVRATFGRSAVAETFDGVSEAGTLDDHLQGLLDAGADTLVVPGPRLRVPADVPLSAYGVGDTVQYRLHDRLPVEGAFRLRKRTVSVAKSGAETVTVEFV